MGDRLRLNMPTQAQRKRDADKKAAAAEETSGKPKKGKGGNKKHKKKGGRGDKTAKKKVKKGGSKKAELERKRRTRLLMEATGNKRLAEGDAPEPDEGDIKKPAEEKDDEDPEEEINDEGAKKKQKKKDGIPGPGLVLGSEQAMDSWWEVVLEDPRDQAAFLKTFSDILSRPGVNFQRPLNRRGEAICRRGFSEKKNLFAGLLEFTLSWTSHQGGGSVLTLPEPRTGKDLAAGPSRIRIPIFKRGIRILDEPAARSSPVRDSNAALF